MGYKRENHVYYGSSGGSLRHMPRQVKILILLTKLVERTLHDNTTVQILHQRLSELHKPNKLAVLEKVSTFGTWIS